MKQQLDYFFGRPKCYYFSSMITKQEISKYCHFPDYNCYIIEKGEKHYFNLPNYPINLIRQDALYLDKEKLKICRQNIMQEIEINKKKDFIKTYQ